MASFPGEGTGEARNVEQDGVVADPTHHRVVFENEFARVIESVIRVGERTPLHTHRRRVMLAVSGSSFTRRDAAGVVIESTRLPDGLADQPRVLWAGPTELHTIENTGADDLVVLAVEIRCAGLAEESDSLDVGRWATRHE